ncbi:MAG: hypothetical protein AAF310_05220 [Myxococcota bacterium]
MLQLLHNKQVVEILLNADGTVWSETLSKGMQQQNIVLSPHDAQALIRSLATPCATHYATCCAFAPTAL